MLCHKAVKWRQSPTHMDDSFSDRSSHIRSSSLTRRRLLRQGSGITALSMAGFAGCVGDPQSSEDSSSSEDSDDPQSPEDFETCGAVTINIEALPDPARTEVETALENGQYETDEELYLPHLMDIDTSYLLPDTWVYRRAEVAYQAVVSQDGATNTLELEEAVPTHGEKPLGIRNEGDEQVTVEVHIKRLRTDETLYEETLTIDSGSKTETAAFNREIGEHGEYQLTITSEDQITVPNWEEVGDDGWTIQWREYSDERPRSYIELNGEPEPHPQLHLYQCASWAES